MTTPPSRRVLLAAVGFTPQVITETVHELYRRGGPDALPHEIHVISTSTGAERVRRTLFGEQRWFERLSVEYDLPPIAFDESHVHAITSEDGTPLADIRDAVDNTLAADAILRLVRRFTDDESCAIHASIAGGRKTMGFYLGYAMILLGRPQDALSHVLVESDFESVDDFFYPSRESRPIENRAGKRLDARDARVTLAEVPLLPLRYMLPVESRRQDASFSDAVDAARAIVGPPVLRLELGSGEVRAAGRRFVLEPDTAAMLAVLMRSRLDGESSIPRAPKLNAGEGWTRRLSDARRFSGMAPGRLERSEENLTKHALTGDEISGKRSRLNRALKRHLGPRVSPYLVVTDNRRPPSYRLDIAPEHLELRYGPDAGRPLR